MISVVIPTYNEGKNIEKCLKSLLKQSLPRREYEIIVVDGKSKDNTVKIAKKYADRVVQQKSKRVGGARNDGVRLAKYDIIANTDADCTFPENWLERIKQGFENKRVVCVYGQQDPLEDNYKSRTKLKISNVGIQLLYYLRIYFTVGANVAFRKKPFLDVGGYKIYSAGDDIELPLRLKKKGRIVHDPKMRVFFSMRRYEEEPMTLVLINWFLNILKSVYNVNIKVDDYNKKSYKN